ncbi:MAG: Eco57I restriction-modification methylase domain-containing protein [Promethearchaeota archaeon]
MKDFVDYLRENNIVQQLRNIYNLKEDESKDTDTINILLDDLYNLEVQENINLNANDIVGKLYEKKIPNSQKKKYGEFYTPINIVEYILNSIGYTSNNELESMKIIDLSCGCGSFLVEIIKRLVEFHLKDYSLVNLSDLSYDQVLLIINDIQENVYGLDINPLACILCCINLYFSIYNLIKIAIQNNPDFKIPKFKIYNINALEFNEFNRFNFVVGNPPYIFLRNIDSNDKHLIKIGNFETIKGQYDYYQVFIELGIRVLKNSGYLGFIVPDSLLVLSNRRVIRKFIYTKTKIRELFYIGKCFNDPVVSNVIIILEKEEDKKKRLENQIILKNHFNRAIIQIVLKKWNYNFLLNLNDNDVNILDYLISKFLNIKEINKSPSFKIKISRGVEIGKHGKILYCKKCQNYIPLPAKNKTCKYCDSYLNLDNIEKIVVDNIPQESENDYEPFLFSMSRYFIKAYKYINIKKKGINYKDLGIYKNRIVIRQLSQNNMICATYDKYSLTSQSFYNLKIIKSSLPEFNHYYLLGLLNSQLLSYYFIKMFSSYKELFPRILIEKIKNLPILLPRNPKEVLIARNIQRSVKKILDLKGGNNKQMKDLQAEINHLVFEIYKISNEKKIHILDFLKENR